MGAVNKKCICRGIKVLFLIFFSQLFFSTSYAQTSVDPLETIQQFRAAPSSSTKTAVYDWTSAMFTDPGTTYSPLVMTNAVDSTQDASIVYLGNIFGEVPSVLSPSINTTIMTYFFSVFNQGVMCALGLMIAYNIFISVTASASQGEFMGKKQQSPALQILRTVMGATFLYPHYNGYNFIQIFTMWVVTQGAYFADAAWAEIINVTVQATSIMPYVKLLPESQTTSTQQAQADCDPNNGDSQSSQCIKYENTYRPAAITLAENILKAQACLDYYVAAVEQEYNSCMAVYGGTVQESVCSQPCRNDYIIVDDSNYSLTINTSGLPLQSQDQSASAVAPQCGTFTMSTNGNTSFQSAQWDAFKTLFTALGPKSPSSLTESCSGAPEYTTIYETYYDPSDDCSSNDSGLTCPAPCYYPGTGDVDTLAENVVNGTTQCAFYTNVTSAINAYIGTLSNQSISDTPSETGGGTLGFVAGGWITASVSYGSLINYISVPGISSNAMSETISSTTNLMNTTLEEMKNISYYIIPSLGNSFTPSTYVGGVLDLILQDWNNDLVASITSNETNNADTVTDSPTIGWAVFACLFGADTVAGHSCSEYGPLSGYFPDFSSSDLKLPTPTISFSNDTNVLMYLPMGYIAQGYSISQGVYNSIWEFIASGYYSGIGPVAFSDSYSSEIQTYVSGMHNALILGLFGGDNIQLILDPIHRMQVMGLTIIQLATTYTGDMVNTALDYANNVILEWVVITTSLSVTQIVASMISNLLAIVWQIGWEVSFEVAPECLGIPLVGFIIFAIVFAIGQLVMQLILIVQVIFYFVSTSIAVVLMILPIFLTKMLMTAFKWFETQIYLVIPLYLLGGYLGIYVSMVPYLIYLLTVCGWFLLVVEAMVIAPIVALGLVYSEGSEYFGRSEQYISLLVILFTRPILILLGFVLGIILASISLFLLNIAFFPVITDAIGFITNNSSYTSEIAQAFQSYANGSTGTVPTITLSVTQLITIGLMMLFYAYIAASVVYQCLSTTFMIPYQAIRWIDPRAQESPQEVMGGLNETKQQFVGELIGGLANSVQVLSGLSNRLFGMMGYTGSQGSFQQAQGVDQTSAGKAMNSSMGTQSERSEQGMNDLKN